MYENPEKISRSIVYDKFVLEVVEPSLFVSTSLKSLDPSSFKAGGTTISKFVPPPIVNKREAEAIKNSG